MGWLQMAAGDSTRAAYGERGAVAIPPQATIFEVELLDIVDSKCAEAGEWQTQACDVPLVCQIRPWAKQLSASALSAKPGDVILRGAINVQIDFMTLLQRPGRTTYARRV